VSSADSAVIGFILLTDTPDLGADFTKPCASCATFLFVVQVTKMLHRYATSNICCASCAIITWHKHTRAMVSEIGPWVLVHTTYTINLGILKVPFQQRFQQEMWHFKNILCQVCQLMVNIPSYLQSITSMEICSVICPTYLYSFATVYCK
jgi:hypothetical protein